MQGLRINHNQWHARWWQSTNLTKKKNILSRYAISGPTDFFSLTEATTTWRLQMRGARYLVWYVARGMGQTLLWQAPSHDWYSIQIQSLGTEDSIYLSLLFQNLVSAIRRVLFFFTKDSWFDRLDISLSQTNVERNVIKALLWLRHWHTSISQTCSPCFYRVLV